MPTDRPRDPDTPDHPTPDPAHPAEPDSARTDPTRPLHEHHPLPPYPEDAAAHPGLERYPVPPNPDEAAAARGSEPTIRFATPATDQPAPDLPSAPASGHPGSHEPTLALPSESDFSADHFEHHPVPPYPEGEPEAPAPGGAAETPGGGQDRPGGQDPALVLPGESGSGAGESGGPGEHRPTLPLPADFGAGEGERHEPHHRLAGESHGGAGPFGEPEVGVSTPPTFDLPVPSLEPEAPPLPAIATPPRRGKITTQEAGVTQPRPPTVAEARAREKARKRAEEAERAAAEAEEAKRRKKKRVLIGGAAVVGIAALVGGGYLVAQAWNGPEVTAYCTVVAKNGEVVPIGNGQTVTATQDNQEITVPDNYCSDAEDHGNSGINPGFFFLAGHSYRYYYGGTGTIGHAPTGGSINPPSGATVKTKSGSTIQRGGLGAKLHGKGGS
ncbi:hypothetical protein VMT65_15765 [Nocardia sp. CDC153]|uniref:hypothetical protein n=1 Tax=Nocardia sp. CDC153 TaxID=3112167 RepID=UPI002DBE956C|nr:hypothetical protein [Nocardia sp. CDC153]MEC3954499.1 hypothetical protein [Nocardia sp. CDC153]